MTVERVQIPKRDEWLDADGKFSLAGLQALGRLVEVFDLSEQIETLSVDQWSWFIEFPEDKDYDLIINSPYACTINSVTTDCTAGTGTLTGKINTTALGGTANSVSTTESEQTHSSANSLAAGDNFRITMSATSGLENMSVTVKITRTL